MAAPISAEQTLNGQEGAVVMKLITNSVHVDDPAETLSNLRLERISAPGEKPGGWGVVGLTRTRSATSTTAVFSGMVAPGRYIIKDIVGLQRDTLYNWPIGAKFGSFDVVPGEVTLLGTLLIQPTGGLSFVAGHVPPEAELQKTFETLYPALAAQTRGLPQHGFLPTPELKMRAALTTVFKLYPSIWDGFAQPANGEFMAGSKLGKVLWRKPNQSFWKQLDVGTWREVLSVRPYRGGLLAAGEEGLLRHSTDEGETWKDLTPPDHGVMMLAQPMRDGSVVAISRRDSDWTFYASKDLEAGEWQKLGEFSESRASRGVFGLPERAGVLMANGKLLYTDGRALLLASTGRPALSVEALPDGTMVSQVLGGAKTTLLSTDWGQTWADLETNRLYVAVTFKDRQTGYAVGPIAPGTFRTGKFGLMTTRDGGKNWSQTGSPPDTANPTSVRQMMVDRADGALIALLPRGRIMRSTDEGKNWEAVLKKK